MKKIMVLLGSPRKNGNSTILANEVMKGITTAGGTYEAFYLNGMNIKPCQACDHCMQNDDRRCIIDDDMQTISSKLKETDVFVLASPIYMFTFSAQLKLFMDRCYNNLLAFKGKHIAIILTYGDTNEYTSGGINAINTFKNLYNYTQSEIVSILHGSANDEGEIASNKQLMEQSFLLGKKLVE